MKKATIFSLLAVALAAAGCQQPVAGTILDQGVQFRFMGAHLGEFSTQQQLGDFPHAYARRIAGDTLEIRAAASADGGRVLLTARIPDTRVGHSGRVGHACATPCMTGTVTFVGVNYMSPGDSIAYTFTSGTYEIVGASSGRIRGVFNTRAYRQGEEATRAHEPVYLNRGTFDLQIEP